MARELPDPDLSLRDAADFVLESTLGRKALGCGVLTGFAVFLRDLLGAVHRLASSCQLPEFTDHGVPHLCSVVDRLSCWTSAPTSGRATALSDLLTPEQAAVLLAATLFHDVGMLSQRTEDLPPDDPAWQEKGDLDLAAWVRKTHVSRMDRLVGRIMRQTEQGRLLDAEPMKAAVRVAKAHSSWPWQTGFADLAGVEPGLAAALAVSDLLDEDSARCDTTTMLDHRQGTLANVGHWVRHCLTDERVLVEEGVIEVAVARPPATDAQLEPVFQALRNHYGLAKLYVQPLGTLGTGLLDVRFQPMAGCPSRECTSLAGWDRITGLATQRALAFHVLNSLMPIALLDAKRMSSEEASRTRGLGMEAIDLTWFHAMRGEVEVRSEIETAFHAIADQEGEGDGH